MNKEGEKVKYKNLNDDRAREEALRQLEKTSYKRNKLLKQKLDEKIDRVSDDLFI